MTIQTLATSPLALAGYQYLQSHRLVAAMMASLLLHAIVFFGVTFQFPQPKSDKIASSLEVVLVNNKTQTKPKESQLLAQDNLDGGGNTEEDRRAKTPFPVLPRNKPVIAENVAQQKVKQLEQEAKKLMAAVSETPQIELPKEHKNELESKSVAVDSTDLLLRSLDIARLRAQIDQDHDSYQKRPKRKFVGARTKEFRFARYVEDWRIKVERIGNLNYPEAARKEKLYGNLQLTVGIRADGSLESIEINRSSGEKILDEAAVNIVKLAGQNGFAPFPPDISQDTDILHITRTWVFAASDMLLSQ
ncbi:protein TonB [Nitrosomonas oligotropha]|uniref:Protein TonB n=2 Tax=Nitrosomonas oligotropha TaxID=42354 RepID=A0A1H8V8E8_9PROT|nr:energy transducer TonB [Nitrosomonas oligotropha]PTQ77294.1 protein TonB [Nitrosomonas oligotropha]SDX55083.1 protein TonB [Nitrosomonas oligotropha]SEP11567.1 protein TonB [Nitrosomonas oligotropha]